MKKKMFLLIVTISLFLPLFTYAQQPDTEKKKFGLSLKYGFSISREKTEPPILKRIQIEGISSVYGGNFQLAYGPNFGMTLDYNILDYLALEFDFNYLYEPMTPESQEMRAQLYSYIVVKYKSEGYITNASLSIMYDLAKPYKKLLKTDIYVGGGIGYYVSSYEIDSHFRYVRDLSQWNEYSPIIENIKFKLKPSLGFHFAYKIKKNVGERFFIFTQGKIGGLKFTTEKIEGVLDKDTDTYISEPVHDEYVLMPEDLKDELSDLKKINANFFLVSFGFGIKF